MAEDLPLPYPKTKEEAQMLREHFNEVANAMLDSVMASMLRDVRKKDQHE